MVAVGVVVVSTGGGHEEMGPSGEGDTRRTIALAVASSVCFGLGLFIQGTTSDDVALAVVVAPPTVMGVLLVTLPLLVARRLQPPRGALAAVVGVAVAELAGFWSFAIGARHSVAIAAVLSSQFAAVSAVIAVVVFRERLGRLQLLGLATTCVAVGLLALEH
jgi:drug/metabolite transporter (DMT)-like permease